MRLSLIGKNEAASTKINDLQNPLIYKGFYFLKNIFKNACIFDFHRVYLLHSK